MCRSGYMLADKQTDRHDYNNTPVHYRAWSTVITNRQKKTILRLMLVVASRQPLLIVLLLHSQLLCLVNIFVRAR